MPSKTSAVTFDCRCEQCILEGGKTIPISQRIPHLRHVKAESAARREAIAVLHQPITPTPLKKSPAKLGSSFSTPCPHPQATSPSISIPDPPVVNTSKCNKREQNHHTIKAHKVLNLVERRCQQCLDRLTSTIFSLADFPTLEQDIAQLQKAFNTVKRDVPSINQRKIVVGHHLTNLQHQFAEFCAAHPIPDQPVLYNSGMLFSVDYVHLCLTHAVFQTIILPGKLTSMTLLPKLQCLLLLFVMS